MLAAGDFMPKLRIDRREARIAVDAQAHVSDGKTRGLRHGLGVDVGSAGDDDRIRRPAQRIAARRRKRGSRRLGATTMPGAAKARSRLTTIVVRPFSGLPIDR